MYTKIINPYTGKKVNVHGRLGRNIIKNYLKTFNNYIGGSASKNKNTIKVLHYNGTITGSRELRNYNKIIVSKQYSSKDNKIPDSPHHYFYKYDQVKNDEPFYDAFVVHLAHLKPENFSEYGLDEIRYYQQKLNDNVITPNTHDSTIFNSLITPTDENTIKRRYYDSVNDKIIDEIYDKDSCHIFILSPMSKQLVKDIKEFCNEENINIIIHIQGDVSRGNVSGDNDGTGMHKKEGMFPEAFNLFSGGESFKDLRNFLKESNAEFYSVSPIATDSEEVRNNSIQCESKKSKINNLKDPDLTKALTTLACETTPIYYKKTNTDILNLTKMKMKNNTDKERKEEIIQNDLLKKFDSLNIKAVFQDGTDKDNLASMIALCKFNLQKNIPIYFMGIRIYISSSKGMEVPKENRTLDFKGSPFSNPTCEYSKPADTRGADHGNQKFDPEITNSFYFSQADGFEKVLKTVVTNFTLKRRKEYIVDGLGPVSESFRAPFNMSLFFFTPDTYQEKALIRATKIFNANNKNPLAAAQDVIKGVTVNKDVNTGRTVLRPRIVNLA